MAAKITADQVGEMIMTLSTVNPETVKEDWMKQAIYTARSLVTKSSMGNGVTEFSIRSIRIVR